MNNNNYNPQELPGEENRLHNAANNNLQTEATNARTFFEPEFAEPEIVAMPDATMNYEDAEAENAYEDAMAFCDWDDDYGSSGERYGGTMTLVMMLLTTHSTATRKRHGMLIKLAANRRQTWFSNLQHCTPVVCKISIHDTAKKHLLAKRVGALPPTAAAPAVVATAQRHTAARWPSLPQLRGHYPVAGAPPAVSRVPA